MLQFTGKCVFIASLAILAALAGTPGAARADGLIANWTLSDAGTPGNTLTAGATIADASGNGHTATLMGSDTLTSIAAPIGTGLTFNGLSGTGNCLSVPYSASLGGMYYLTFSAWVYYPNGTSNSNAVLNTGQQIFNLWNQDGGTDCYKLGYYLPEPNDRMEFTASGSESLAWGSVWNTFNGNGPDYTAGQWAQWTMVYNGNNGSDVGTCDIFQNGVCVTGGALYNGHFSSPAAGQALQLAGGDNEWLGSLDDLGMWNVALTNGCTLGTTARGCSGGEVSALYNTPMYNNHAGPLSQYGVKAMDQLFTLYGAANPANVSLVTTSNGALAWRYVASGLSLGSGAAGQPVSGQYAVQLDSAGGGVETVLPGDANLDGKVDVNDLTVVLTNFGKTGGTSWGTGDFNGDGKVDVNDLTVVLSHFGQSLGASAGSPAAVPEPASLALLICCGLAALLTVAVRRRG